jgi:DeoR/GlpR family transcriptional regulator of sugar metabolism
LYQKDTVPCNTALAHWASFLVLVESASTGGMMGEIEQIRTEYRSSPDERRLRILEIIRQRGSVSIALLEEEFGISPMTARRDLASLEQDGWLRRTHGGAILPPLAVHEGSFQSRLDQNVEAKGRLAKAAVELIEPGEAVFIDCSTTCYYCVRALLTEGREATILTNSVPVMELFHWGSSPNVELVGLGGVLRHLTLSFVGPQTVTAISGHFADKALFSVKGITPQGHLTDPDPLETEVKRKMIERSETSILVADGGKFENRGLIEVGHVSDVSLVLTTEAPEERRGAIASFGVEVRDV